MPRLPTPRQRRLRIDYLACVVGLTLFAHHARAADHFLTIGGGYAPSGNQLSLERNVIFFRDVLTALYPKGAKLPHDVFFSDGDDPARDLQFEDPTWVVPEVNRLLARLADEEEDLGFRYRSHELKDVRGPSTRAAVDKWFTDVGAKLAKGDRLILYVTGHGGHSEGDNYGNNHLSLWAGGSLTVRELADRLDKLPEGVSVVVVMVQCFSGGFADLLFAGGQSQNGFPRNVRCGF